jgi:hypothetical protein
MSLVVTFLSSDMLVAGTEAAATVRSHPGDSSIGCSRVVILKSQGLHPRVGLFGGRVFPHSGIEVPRIPWVSDCTYGWGAARASKHFAVSRGVDLSLTTCTCYALVAVIPHYLDLSMRNFFCWSDFLVLIVIDFYCYEYTCAWLALTKNHYTH